MRTRVRVNTSLIRIKEIVCETETLECGSSIGRNDVSVLACTKERETERERERERENERVNVLRLEDDLCMHKRERENN